MKKEKAECIGGEYIKKTRRDFFKDGGKVIKDNKTLDKIDKVNMPKTYDNVHICKFPERGHILGYGYDKDDKKQILYTQGHVNERKKEKCNNLKKFSLIQEKIERWMLDKLKTSKKFDWDTIMAITMFLLMHCNFRVGNEVYVENYESYGVTTLECRHFKNKEQKAIEIVFNGKKGVENKHICDHKLFVPIMKRLYNDRCKGKAKNTSILVDDEGRQISSKQVNLFLKEYDENISSKDIRIWNANKLFLSYWKDAQLKLGDKMSDKDILKEVIERSAEDLYHTPQVAKKEYLSPQLLDILQKDPQNLLGIVRKIKNDDKMLRVVSKKFLC